MQIWLRQICVHLADTAEQHHTVAMRREQGSGLQVPTLIIFDFATDGGGANFESALSILVPETKFHEHIVEDSTLLLVLAASPYF